jgi:hypothetical protein
MYNAGNLKSLLLPGAIVGNRQKVIFLKKSTKNTFRKNYFLRKVFFVYWEG